MAASIEPEDGLSRADLLIRLYKNLINNNITLRLDLEIPVNYTDIKNKLNKYLQPSQHITEN